MPKCRIFFERAQSYKRMMPAVVRLIPRAAARISLLSYSLHVDTNNTDRSSVREQKPKSASAKSERQKTKVLTDGHNSKLIICCTCSSSTIHPPPPSHDMLDANTKYECFQIIIMISGDKEKIIWVCFMGGSCRETGHSCGFVLTDTAINASTSSQTHNLFTPE